MKLVVVVVLAMVAMSRSAAIDEPVAIVRSEFVQQPEGSYTFEFEGANGIVRSEYGELKEAFDEDNKPHQVVVVRGSYSYPGEDGKPISISFVADENGYQAEGDSIPKLPSK